ncbi:response regulator transcription factor [Paenibacillus abyssi]|uniref:DNA-binding response regulator n=1 Tax=Paenibacillus abyssi TaxID=1340531 RepID=A0A917CWJ8_9BACL|nr:response regulator [Paenibacillus abyssi]GGG00150.1 DNA-binding response regulator [Paenibacillus abyssi]
MLNVMVVDDEPIILNGLINIIEKVSTPCSTIQRASDGYDALEKLEDYKPDLIITDIQMPEMNGFELINEVRNRGLCQRFVILSGYDDTNYLRQAIRCKTIDYLLKPVNKTELYNVLSNISLELLNESKRVSDNYRPIPETNILINGNANISENTKKIIKYVDQYYFNDLSLDQIAEYIHLHPNYISHLFKKETGLSFIQYLHLYRIKKAKELMIRDPEESLNIISEQVGYENVRHFFNVFKKYNGVTPGKYREQYKYKI